ncbi:MAG: plasmid pRiA4b ORF-3 family protein [Gemmatimonadota bacterium]|nr:plasmid pRiA4b ORF-3 family protein [Gemmatimonadota bacterium]
MRHIKPPIWREIDVPDNYSLLQLHRCIQLVFGWLDYHLFEFQVGNRRFEAADPEAEGEDAARVKLRELKLTPRSSFLYIYDMGDSWEHDITVRAVAVARPGEELDNLRILLTALGLPRLKMSGDHMDMNAPSKRLPARGLLMMTSFYHGSERILRPNSLIYEPVTMP